MNKKIAIGILDTKCKNIFGCSMEDATSKQLYEAMCLCIRDILSKKNADFNRQSADSKKVYYMSMEFLVGTSLKNNLYNLGIEDTFKDVIKSLGKDIEDIYALEPDAGLGNGGLGRLASCYMDSMTSLGIPATGYSIRYEFGIFRQKIIDGWQMEFPDDWLTMGDVWLKCRSDEAVEVRFGGRINEYCDNGKYRAEHVDCETVIALPYDMLISGYDTDAVNKLVLWSAKSPSRFDMNAFSRGDYAKAIEESTKAEVISKVLYPADDHEKGKILRLRQQYFFVSASLQTITKKHFNKYGTMDNLPDKVSIHINDTHPALCVPELMRILLDEYELSWDDAWDITQRTLSYTNHTVMSEALEKWREDMYQRELPRIYQITAEINRRLMGELRNIYPSDRAKLDYMAVISGGEVRMANLCLAACRKINGVSSLHSQILKESIFRDYNTVSPEKFTNVTNGIAYRRWLCQANPLLSDYIESLIGSGFKNDASVLTELMRFKGNKEVLSRLYDIKRQNKERLCSYILSANGIKADPSSVFDVQVKRLHEYKRQLLNVLGILHMYRELKDNPNMDFTPRTFVFAAKASAGYFMAKEIIRLICAVANVINSDRAMQDKLKVVFLEDYKVSLAEIIIPAAEISEQISVAGKEASGTGNMKLMINGAVTLGTLDGANVEIRQCAGEENMFLFGMNADEVNNLWRQGYYPTSYVNANPRLKAVLDMLTSGVLGSRFDTILNSLLASSGGTADAYMALADFESYVNIQKKAGSVYLDKYKFTDMSLANIANAGFFSSDRAIREYAEGIWNIKL